MIIDANILLYACNTQAPEHAAMREWFETALNGPTQVALPWQSLTAFLRLSTSPRSYPAPLSPARAASQVREWLAAPTTLIPTEGPKHIEILTDLLERHAITGPLVMDAKLAALAIENGVEMVSTDGDFARFSEIRWKNPLADA